MGAQANGELFDRRFVIAATIIGVAYAAIVVTLGWVAGKDAAGVAGVALTALATGVFKQFETLRFRAIAKSEQREIRVPKLSGWRIGIICCTCLGIQALFGVLVALLLSVFRVPGLSGNEDSMAALSNAPAVIETVGVAALGFLAAGFLITRAFGLSLYSEIVIAAFITSVAGRLITILVQPGSSVRIGPSDIWYAMFYLLYAATALCGAWLGSRRYSKKALPSHPAKRDT